MSIMILMDYGGNVFRSVCLHGFLLKHTALYHWHMRSWIIACMYTTVYRIKCQNPLLSQYVARILCQCEESIHFRLIMRLNMNSKRLLCGSWIILIYTTSGANFFWRISYVPAYILAHSACFSLASSTKGCVSCVQKITDARQVRKQVTQNSKLDILLLLRSTYFTQPPS